MLAQRPVSCYKAQLGPRYRVCQLGLHCHSPLSHLFHSPQSHNFPAGSPRPSPHSQRSHSLHCLRFPLLSQPPLPLSHSSLHHLQLQVLDSIITLYFDYLLVCGLVLSSFSYCLVLLSFYFRFLLYAFISVDLMYTVLHSPLWWFVFPIQVSMDWVKFHSMNAFFFLFSFFNHECFWLEYCHLGNVNNVNSNNWGHSADHTML